MESCGLTMDIDLMRYDSMRYVEHYFDGFKDVINHIYKKRLNTIEEVVMLLQTVKERKGRLFIIGVGGGASNADHAVNDFRRIAGIDAYAPTNNIGELTAVTNDVGWENVFIEWLKISRLEAKDCLLVLSVGGGSDTTSPNISLAVEYARDVGSTILGILGRTTGTTGRLANINYTLVNNRMDVDDEFITPFIESLQLVIIHAIVNHPDLKEN